MRGGKGPLTSKEGEGRKGEGPTSKGGKQGRELKGRRKWKGLSSPRKISGAVPEQLHDICS